MRTESIELLEDDGVEIARGGVELRKACGLITLGVEYYGERDEYTLSAWTRATTDDRMKKACAMAIKADVLLGILAQLRRRR